MSFECANSTGTDSSVAHPRRLISRLVYRNMYMPICFYVKPSETAFLAGMLCQKGSKKNEKPVFGLSDQVRHKPDCTVIEDG